jgi:hypothetical protein
MRAAVGVGVAALLLAGCEFRVTQPAPVTVTPVSPPSITITNTNTNTNTTERDRSDTDPDPAPGGGGTGGATVLPLPAYGEGVAREIAAAHPALLAHSCELTSGAAAWGFLDRLVRALQARDARWGYLCKDAGCTKVAADIVAYRASAGDTGIWIVDVIGNHCPGSGDVVTVRWGVLPFETVRRWIGVRP